MSDEQGILEDVLAHPDDDAPRLVYADWLDEHGQAERGEFIRAQVALARPDLPAPERERLQRRERQLLDEHAATWLGDLAEPFLERLDVRFAFARGWIARLRATGIDLVAEPQREPGAGEEEVIEEA